MADSIKNPNPVKVVVEHFKKGPTKDGMWVTELECKVSKRAPTEYRIHLESFDHKNAVLFAQQYKEHFNGVTIGDIVQQEPIEIILVWHDWKEFWEGVKSA